MTNSGSALTKETVDLYVKMMLLQEFVCDSYKEMTRQLLREGLVINGMRMLKLMVENSPLNYSYNRSSPISRIEESKLTINEPNQAWEAGTKYFWIAGEESNTHFLGIIDCFIRRGISSILY